MARLDRAFAEEAAARLEALPADAQPKWGSLTRDGVIAHLAGSFGYSMGQVAALPPQSGPPMRKLVSWLLINGIIPFPKGVKFKGNDGQQIPALSSEGGIVHLREIMEEFIALVDRGDQPPCGHPVFGEYTGEEWLKFHRAHLNHHLKQFGA